MKKTYVINIISADSERNEFLHENGLNRMIERFYSIEEANEFCRQMNDTVAFRAYNEMAYVEREI